MEHSVKGTSLLFCAGEDALEEGPVSQVAFNKLNALRKKITVAVAEAVENDSMVTALRKEARDGTPDITCTACNEYLHKNLSLC
jgi:hypothetical protein